MADPYERQLVNRTFYHSKTPLRGRVVAVLQGLLENRSLQLIKPISRTFPAGTIIELIATDEQGAGPGGVVDRIAYVAFVELLDGGVLLVGDPVLLNGREIGRIAGYDETHMPNHQNTIISVDQRRSGADLGLSVGDPMFIPGFPT
jgi:hypothetical protein